MRQACAAYFGNKRQAGFDQAEGLRLNLEIEAGREADCPEHTGGIVHEGQGVQHPDLLLLQVAVTSPKIEDLTKMAAVQAQGKGVDGEIPAVEVHFNAAALHCWQGSRFVVELGAG